MPPPIPMSEKTRIKKAKETNEENIYEKAIKKIPVLVTRISGNNSSFFGFNAKGK